MDVEHSCGCVFCDIDVCQPCQLHVRELEQLRAWRDNAVADLREADATIARLEAELAAARAGVALLHAGVTL